MKKVLLIGLMALGVANIKGGSYAQSSFDSSSFKNNLIRNVLLYGYDSGINGTLSAAKHVYNNPTVLEELKKYFKDKPIIVTSVCGVILGLEAFEGALLNGNILNLAEKLRLPSIGAIGIAGVLRSNFKKKSGLYPELRLGILNNIIDAAESFSRVDRRNMNGKLLEDPILDIFNSNFIINRGLNAALGMTFGQGINVAYFGKSFNRNQVMQVVGQEVGKGFAIQVGAKIGQSLSPHGQGKQKGAFVGAVLSDGVIDTFNNKRPGETLKATDFMFSIVENALSNILSHEINAHFNAETNTNNVPQSGIKKGGIRRTPEGKIIIR